jgi:hypothetical protein
MSAFRSVHFVGGFLVHEECWTVHDEADSPPGAFQIALSPLLFELCFHVGLIWDLFLWLVCLL